MPAVPLREDPGYHAVADKINGQSRERLTRRGDAPVRYGFRRPGSHDSRPEALTRKDLECAVTYQTQQSGVAMI
jgi:hypothetical protein